ncbi:hypothetical protein [Haloglycomyces albus]|uniref:hypothetical protein n=1 Tax=Haloglycomyces albus TaxID=526067 RepID=UPI00046CAB3E|nr:hypothetical protein [Haloglycomyces albus]
MSEAIKTSDDMARRAKYLDEVRDMLFPHQGGATRSYIAVPNLRKPRVLIPAERSAASGALQRYAWPATASARLKRNAAYWAVNSRLDRLLLRHRIDVPTTDGIDDYLSSAIGHPVLSAIHIGPARANRKPVLHLLDPEGNTVGFAKMGVNDLTRDLVRAERDNLEVLQKRSWRNQLVLPEVAHFGHWRDFNILVTTPIPAWEPPTDHNHRRRIAAMVELTKAFSVTSGPLCQSGYRRRLDERLELLATYPEEDARVLYQTAQTTLPRYAEVELEYGSWHGDWTPWNSRHSGEFIYLWDLERYESDVPLGFDALHYRLQDAIVTEQRNPKTALEELLRAAPALLEPFNVTATQARATAVLYIIDLAVRYAIDRAAEAGAALGALGSWLLPALIEYTHEGRQHD